MIHYAQLEHSPRLQRLNAYLLEQNGRWRTTRDIIVGANICAVNTAVDELRCNGVAVDCRCAGRGRYEYRLGAA